MKTKALYRIDYITTSPAGWQEQWTIYHPRPLTVRGLKQILADRFKTYESEYLTSIAGQWKIER